MQRTNPGFEARPAQARMAAAVARAIDQRRTLLLEAATGSGKTLGALVPLAIHLLDGEERAVYSTGTITLQEQLVTKDIPAVQRAFGGPRAALLKGMGRYLCLLKWGMSRERLGARATPEALQTFAAWVAATRTGDQNELPEVPGWWDEVAADSSDCLGAACSHQLGCFALAARERARAAQLLAVNHHLLLLHRRFGGARTIPPEAAMVVDEAHNLPDVASEVWGSSFTDHTFRALAQRLHGLAPSGADPLHAEVARAISLHDAFMKTVRPAGEEPTSPRVGSAALDEYLGILDRLAGLVGGRQWDIFRDGSGTSANDRAAILLRQLAGYRQAVAEALSPTEGVARWVEPARGKDVSMVFRTAPVDVGAVLCKLFDGEGPRIVMSATLATGGSFAHIRRQLGVREADELVVPPVFDYARQMRYYLPQAPLDPNAADFTALVSRELEALLRATQGRALVLFTSYKQLREVAEALRGRLPYRLLTQAEGSTTAIIQEFRDDVSSVLLATARMWEGVDIPGPALSALVVVRLPFEVPTHPLARARYDAAKARGENPFNSVVIPEAILKLRQGVGRLIRSRTDRGVVAILDGRVQTKGYGRRFLAALPAAPRVRSLDEVAAFLGEAPEVAAGRAGGGR